MGVYYEWVRVWGVYFEGESVLLSDRMGESNEGEQGRRAILACWCGIILQLGVSGTVIIREILSHSFADMAAVQFSSRCDDVDSVNTHNRGVCDCKCMRARYNVLLPVKDDQTSIVRTKRPRGRRLGRKASPEVRCRHKG